MRFLDICSPPRSSAFTSVSELVDSIRSWISDTYKSCLPQPTYRFPSRTVRTVKLLASGGYSFVYEVRDTSSNQHFAMKKMSLQSDEQQALAEIEINIFKTIAHPNVLPLLDVLTVRSPENPAHNDVFLLFPLCRNGSLEEYLTSFNGYLSERQVLIFMRQICLAVRQLHGQAPALAHYDLKPLNLLVSDDESTLYLTDFGSVSAARMRPMNRSDADKIQERAESYTSAPYRAPELWEVEPRVELDERSDIWSLGCILFFLMCKQSPWQKQIDHGDSLKLAALNAKIDWPRPALSFSAALRDTVCWLLAVDFRMRPTIDQVLDRIDFLAAQNNRAATSSKSASHSASASVRAVQMNSSSTQLQFSPHFSLFEEL